MKTSGTDSRHRRVVLVHDWLTGMRGGEKCLEELCRHWPDARLFTLLHRAGSVSPAIERLAPQASWLQLFPGVANYYRYLLPLMPLAARWPIRDCDLVVSLSHCVAKAARPPQGVPHVCYCFTPMRYAWHMRESYFGRGGLKARLIDTLLGRLRDWDRASADRVSHFVAISETVRQRIRECYDRDSVVIYPPVDTDFFCLGPERREDFYLVASALVPYKRIDLAVTACNRLGRELVIIGTGPDENKLRRLAGPRVRVLGWQPDDMLRSYYRRCRALLFPGEEDFGLVPLEAQACGTPVIAFGRGGATESVLPVDGPDEPTGLFFAEQEAECLIEAMRTFEARAGEFEAPIARRQALRFRPQRFREQFKAFVDQLGRPRPRTRLTEILEGEQRHARQK